MGKHILSSAAFLLILLVLLEAFSPVFRPKNNTVEEGTWDVQADGILGEPENSIDVLFLGDSEAYCGIVPMEIWKDYGITSYLCSTPAQRMYQAEEYLRTALRTQQPKIVVVEPLSMYRDYSPLEVVTRMTGEWLPVVRYHDRWKSLQAEDFYQSPRYTHVEAEKGYRLFQGTRAADTEGYMEPTVAVEHIPSKNVKHLVSIQRVCQEQGVQLMLVSVPSTRNWSGRRHNAVTALAESMGIVYLDLNCMWQEIPIDWEVDTWDEGDHMNLTGAKKVSVFIGKWLADTGLFEDKRSREAYSQWNRFLQEYLESTAADKSNDKK